MTKVGDDLDIHIPTTDMLMKQKKKRAKTKSEMVRENEKMKVNEELQRMGLSQEVANNAEYSVLVNGKVGSGGKCTFCSKDRCRINACNERRDRQHEGMEYVLTNENVMAERALRDRLTTTNVVMMSQEDNCGNVIETLHKNDMGRNFMIVKKRLIDGQPFGKLESMAFLVRFLGKNGKPCVLDGDKWISGGL